MESTFARLVSIGLATPEYEVPVFTDEPKFPSYFHPKPDGGPYLAGEPYGLSLSQDRLAARTKALAEFYERLCLYNARFDPEPTSWDPKGGLTDPAAFAAPGTSPDREQALRTGAYRWMRTVEIESGRETAVPAQVVIPSFAKQGEESIISAVGTSGAALGQQGAGGALERGLFEVVERHILSSCEFKKLFRHRVVNLPPKIREIENTLRRYRLEPYVFRLPNRFPVPCVYVTLTDASGIGPAVSFASRAAPTFGDTIEIALLEALERRRPARVEQSSLQPGDRRVYPWEPLERLREIEPLLKAAATEDFRSLPEEPFTVEDLRAALRAEAGDILVVDVTLPEVEAAGFEALKVLVPGLGPLPA